MRNTSTQNVIFDFQADMFDHSNLDFVGGGMLFAVLGERDPQTSADELPLGATKKGTNTKAWKEELKAAWDSVATITLQGESLPDEDQYLDLDPTYQGSDGKPLLRLRFD